MKLENRLPPEGINVSKAHPLKEFVRLLAGVALFVAAAVGILAVLAEQLAPLVPFRMEEKLLDIAGVEMTRQELSEQEREIQDYIQALGARLAAQMDLPEGVDISIHYSAGSTVNAFATLGGHVVIYRGLLEKLPHENSLAMVLAHEIAHVKARHPIVSAGRSITVALALLAVTGMTESNTAAKLVSRIGFTTTLSFGRDQERDADNEALNALEKHYGHAMGADALFTVLQKSSGGLNPPAVLSTHPAPAERIDRIREIIAAGAPVDAQLTPLPGFMQNLPQGATGATP